jgi:hypothetical protein
MKTYGGVDVQIHVLLPSALVGGELSTLHFTPVTNSIRDWVSPRADLDDVDRRKILPLPGLNSNHSAVQSVPSCCTNCDILAPTNI